MRTALHVYDPYVDLAENWPDWTVQLTSDNGPSEEFDTVNKKILLHTEGHREVYLVAHAVAHLSLRHHLQDIAFFTLQQENDASALARLKLWDRCPSKIGSSPQPDRHRKIGPATMHAQLKGQCSVDPEMPDFDEGYCPSLRVYPEDVHKDAA
jgi:hypothetical protein